MGRVLALQPCAKSSLGRTQANRGLGQDSLWCKKSLELGFLSSATRGILVCLDWSR
jgi:hypothetical protein